MVATINRHDGGDGGWVRRCLIENTRVNFTIDEDQYNDTERNHGGEAAGVAAFSQSFDAVYVLLGQLL